MGTLLRGKAVGGPRDGVVLSAEYDWDGRIALPKQRSNGGQPQTQYYKGRYEWKERACISSTWVWVTGPLQLPATRPSRTAY